MTLFNRLLYYYCLLFTLTLTAGAVFSGFALTNVIPTLLFLPISLYFIYYLVKNAYVGHLRRVYLKAHPPKVDQAELIQNLICPPSPTTFRLDAFLTQKSPFFIATLGLYCLVLATVLFRATVNFLPQPEFVSPLPSHQSPITRSQLIQTKN